MIYGWLGELIKSLNRTPGSITEAITTIYGRRMATTTFLSACLSFELPNCLSSLLSLFLLSFTFPFSARANSVKTECESPDEFNYSLWIQHYRILKLCTPNLGVHKNNKKKSQRHARIV